MIELANGLAHVWVCPNCGADNIVPNDPQTRCFICGRTARRLFIDLKHLPRYLRSSEVEADALYNRSGASSEDISWPPAITDPS